MYKNLKFRPKAPTQSEEARPDMPNVPNVTHARKMLEIAQASPEHPVAKKLIEYISEKYPQLVGDSGLGGAEHQEQLEEMRQKLAGPDASGDMAAETEGANAETAEQADGLAETQEMDNARGKKAKSKDLAPA